MRQKDFYISVVEEGSKYRYQINEDFYKKGMNPIQNIIRFLIGLTPEEFKFIHDMNYYQHGGFPYPDSPPKIDAFLDKFVLLVKYFYFLGWEDKINNRINEHGIFIKLENPLIDEEVNKDYLKDPKTLKQFTKNWQKVFGDCPMNFKTKKETLLDILNQSYDLQYKICTFANKIRKELAPAVEDKCGIKKSHFEKAVYLQYKKIKNELEDKDNEEDIQKVKEDIENQIEAISIF